MSAYYRFKRWLKLLRWEARRTIAAQRWGKEYLKQAPVLFGNSMPKSGSHLIIQMLQGFTRIGPFVNPGFPPVNRAEDNSKLKESEIMVNIKRLRSGDIAYGYLHASDPYFSELKKPGMASVFIYRDPRDMIVSHVYYATHMNINHGMHRYYSEVLHSMEERINAAIQGVDEKGSIVTPIKTKYANYLGWLSQADVLCMRFEDLILDQESAINKLIDFIAQRGYLPSIDREEANYLIRKSVVPKRSGTFRKAEPGNWKEHFTETNKSIFKDNTGDLLLELGYEKDYDW